MKQSRVWVCMNYTHAGTAKGMLPLVSVGPPYIILFFWFCSLCVCFFFLGGGVKGSRDVKLETRGSEVAERVGRMGSETWKSSGVLGLGF